MIGLGLNIWTRWGGAQNPADWPELKLWLKFDEGPAGTALVDHSADPISGGMPIVSATHDPWSVAGSFQTAAAHDDAAFSYAYATRPNIGKLASPENKAVLIEAYGAHAAYNANVSEHIVTIADYGVFTSGVEGYALRVRREGVADYRVEIAANGTTAANRNNAGGVNTTQFAVDTVAHIAAWFAGGASTVAGAAVDGVSNNQSMDGAVGSIVVTATNTSSRWLRVGALEHPTIVNTSMYPGTFQMVRIWHFDTLPANITDIVAQMAADPLRLPPLLKQV